MHIPTNKNDLDSLYEFKDSRKPYNLLHLNALYDLNQHTYEDAIVLKSKLSNECRALTDMVDRSTIKTPALILADRGYESYNNMAHIQEKGWKFLIRIKDFHDHASGILHGLELPSVNEFDVDIDLNLTRKQTNEVKELLKDKNYYRRIGKNTIFDYLPEKNRKSDSTIMYRL
ncbi:transposase, partial [Clostridium yunnanense]|uniref:transposase n=1 Tax=Clostridium yunnanense TaxID=2800325 RepID=UPI0030841099